jgi:hypothetical protein
MLTPRSVPGCPCQRLALMACTLSTVAVLAGVWSGGFAKASSLGKGDHSDFDHRSALRMICLAREDGDSRRGLASLMRARSITPTNSRWNPPYYSFNKVIDTATGSAAAPDRLSIVYGPNRVERPVCRSLIRPTTRHGS